MRLDIVITKIKNDLITILDDDVMNYKDEKDRNI